MNFNLVKDPWILVRTLAGDVVEVSLLDFFLNCQDYREMAGESEQQDVAVLRLLQAISVTLLERFDVEGKEDLLENADQAIERWKLYWDLGHFPKKAVCSYLDRNVDSFWLDAPEGQRRFMQTEAAKKGTHYAAAKLIGTIAESSNKPRWFQSRAGISKAEIDLDSAARWLLYLNAFDDTSAKASADYRKNTKDKKSIGAGWLGKLGLIYALGDTMFQTLMLNSILLKNGDELWEEKNLPQFEVTRPDVTERREIPVPENLAALLTLPSRRVWLDVNENGKVNGFSLIGGDFFPKENAFSEQNTLWRNADPKKKKMDSFVPKRHQPGRQIWRDFQILTDSFEVSKTRRPGVIEWLSVLENAELIPSDMIIRFVTPAVIYGDKDFFVEDLSSHSMAVHADVLGKKGEQTRKLAIEQIKKIDKLAGAASLFMKNISLASGAGPDQALASGTKAADEINSEIDIPFLDWLAALDSKKLETNEQLLISEQSWEKQARSIAAAFARKAARSYRSAAIIGRKQTDKKTDKEYHLSIPEAESLFRRAVLQLYPLPKKEDSNEQA